jgi:hypothetical protein
MDRQIIYPGAIPLETDLLNTNKYAMMGLAKLSAAMMGSNTYLHGLACTPSSPASMVVNVAKGQIYSQQNVDNSAYSSIAADTVNTILKQGVILTSTAFTLTAPTTAGQSINYLIQATYNDTDSGAVTLPYYNAANPSVAYSGPNNSGTAQNTIRSGVCTLSLKAGVAATTGTQTTPSVDTGYTAAWVITVAQGATTITASNISVAQNAPFLPAAGLISSIQQSSMTYAADTGAANAYVAQFVPALPTLNDGMRLTFKAKTANTGSSTFSANGGSAYPLYSHANQALQGGEVIANGLVEVEWNSTLTAWVMCGNSGGALPVAAASQSNHAMQLGQAAAVVTGVVGLSRNARMTVTSASAIADFLADELIVNSALGGNQYRLKSVSARITLTTTGAGGMDTGSAPATGYVAVYVIYNPTSGSVALLGMDATSALAPEVYGGANMPAGYTASSLVAVWPTAISQFVIGNLTGRKLEIATRTLLSSSTVNASRVSLTTTQFPLNAKSIYGNMSVGSTAASTCSIVVWGASSSVGGMPFTMTVTAGGSYAATFSAVSVTNQMIGWSSGNTAGAPTFGIGMGAYEI